jgi:hypothetical protein
MNPDWTHAPLTVRLDVSRRRNSRSASGRVRRAQACHPAGPPTVLRLPGERTRAPAGTGPHHRGEPRQLPDGVLLAMALPRKISFWSCCGSTGPRRSIRTSTTTWARSRSRWRAPTPGPSGGRSGSWSRAAWWASFPRARSAGTAGSSVVNLAWRWSPSARAFRSCPPPSRVPSPRSRPGASSSRAGCRSACASGALRFARRGSARRRASAPTSLVDHGEIAALLAAGGSPAAAGIPR